MTVGPGSAQAVACLMSTTVRGRAVACMPIVAQLVTQPHAGQDRSLASSGRSVWIVHVPDVGH